MNESLIDTNVATKVERRMCRITLSRTENGVTSSSPTSDQYANVFLYCTDAVKEKSILDLPAYLGPRHNGRAIKLGPDNNSLNVTRGDGDGSFNPTGRFVRTLTQNYINLSLVDGRSVILVVDLNDKLIDGRGILGDNYPLVLHFAYRIRNSFGIGFDPLTGNLWDTENGPACADEINLVELGLDSGYVPVHGLWAHRVDPRSNVSDWTLFTNTTLMGFDGRGNNGCQNLFG